jgi:hypothetical protein
MTAAECLAAARDAGPYFQGAINSFLDSFRSANPRERAEMVREPIPRVGPLEGLVGAVVSSLCREVGMEAPAWVAETHSQAPFFAFPARSFALRVRLMLESPPAFRTRNVFVPENYLARA